MPPNMGKGPYGANYHQPNQIPGTGKGTPIRRSPVDRRRLFRLAKEVVRVDRGTPYPCYAKNIESYQCRPKRTRKTPISAEVATNKLVKFLNQHIERDTKEDRAVRRLASGMQLEKWGPDLFIKAFDDLDLVFFRGVLATRTQIHYMTEKEIAREFGGRDRHMFGCTVQLGYGRCRIVLNSTKHFLLDRNPFAQTWSTLLHEMVHG